MFIDRFEASYLFACRFRMVHEIIVQAVRGGTLAVARRGGKVLCNPPWSITELAVETCNLCSLSAARFGVDLRTDILSRRIFGGSFKFPFEFDVPVRIEFENEALAVF